MSKDKHEKVMAAIRRARNELLANHPFFGDLAFGMPFFIKDDINPPTAATDGTKIYYHPDFVLSLTAKELAFVTAHEILHVAYMHTHRIGKRDRMKWNIACDIVVNQILVNNKVGDMPKDLIYDPYTYEVGQGMVDKIYDLLPKNDHRKAMDDFIDGVPMNAAEVAKMRGKLEQARIIAREAGNMPGEIETLLDMDVESTVAWEDELFNEITSTKGDDRTYTKRNRRYAALDVFMPGKEGVRSGDLVYAIDCSGSTSDEMVARCGKEIERAMRHLKPERTHVIYWDTQVKKHEIYGPDDELDINVYGRGGTDVTCVWDYIQEQGIEPEHCIVGTDLYIGNFGEDPGYPVIWCVMESQADNAPFGRLIHAD